jgi:hypothetical protein
MRTAWLSKQPVEADIEDLESKLEAIYLYSSNEAADSRAEELETRLRAASTIPRTCR